MAQNLIIWRYCNSNMKYSRYMMTDLGWNLKPSKSKVRANSIPCLNWSRAANTQTSSLWDRICKNLRRILPDSTFQSILSKKLRCVIQTFGSVWPNLQIVDNSYINDTLHIQRQLYIFSKTSIFLPNHLVTYLIGYRPVSKSSIYYTHSI